MLKKILHEPLLHFFVVGSILFYYLSTNDTTVEKEKVVISKGKIEQLSAQFQKTRQRPATSQELQALIHNQVREELAFKQGKEMGLIEDDSIIKRRVQQKLEFMLNDSVSSFKPTNEELQEYLQAHQEQYMIAPVYSFRQIYINPQKHQDFDTYLQNLKAENLDKKYTEVGDSIMLESNYQNISTAQIARLFGQKFSLSLEKLALKKWIGPVTSGYGVHLVYIQHKENAHMATFKEREAQIRVDFTIETQEKALDDFYEKLKDKYELVVEEAR